MWIKPDYTGSLEDLKKEVEEALKKFEEDEAAGKLVPVDDKDPNTWL